MCLSPRRAPGRSLTTEESLIDAAVQGVMVQDPVTVTPDLELKDLVDLFVREGLPGVPVVARPTSGCSGSSPRAT